MLRHDSDRATNMIPEADDAELAELERVSKLPDDKLEEYVDKILSQQYADDRRTSRQRIALIVLALFVAWGMGAACAARTLMNAGV